MKISIIVPVYNCEEWLRECINSLICSDSPCEYEIILVNDGSTDRSGNICDEYAIIHNCIKVIHTINQGVSTARNIGLENATGEWIIFVDGDDILEENAINDLYYKAEFYKYDLLRFGMFRFNSNGIYPLFKANSTDKQKYIDLTIQRSTILGVCGGIYRRSLFMRYNIRFSSNLHVGEDWVVLFKLLCHAQSFYYYPADLYGYRVNLYSVTQRKITFVRPDALIAFNIILDYAQQQGIKINPVSVYKAKSDLRRMVMKEAILNKSSIIYKETERILNQYAPQSLWKDLYYSRRIKHKIGFIIYRILSFVFCFK